MMKYLVLTFLLPIFAHAQDQLPTKDGKVVFEEVDSVPGVSKDDLYLRGKIWLANTFRSSKAVIQMDDKDAGELIGKANFDYQYVVLMPPGATWTCRFTIQIDCRNGKAKIKIFDIDTHCGGEASAEYVNAHREKKHIRPIYSGCLDMLDGFNAAVHKPAENF